MSKVLDELDINLYLLGKLKDKNRSGYTKTSPLYVQSSRWTRYKSLSQSAWKIERQNRWCYAKTTQLYVQSSRWTRYKSLSQSAWKIEIQNRHGYTKTSPCLLWKLKPRDMTIDERDMNLYHSLLGTLDMKTHWIAGHIVFMLYFTSRPHAHCIGIPPLHKRVKRMHIVSTKQTWRNARTL